MRKNQQGNCVQSIKDTLRTAGLPQNPTVQFSFRPRFTREMVKETRIFISPAAPDTERVTRASIQENPVFEVALVRAIPTADCDYIEGNVDLDSHSLDAMFDLQSKLISALYSVPSVTAVESVTGPNNDRSNDGIWFTLYKVTFQGELS